MAHPSPLTSVCDLDESHQRSLSPAAPGITSTANDTPSGSRTFYDCFVPMPPMLSGGRRWLSNPAASGITSTAHDTPSSDRAPSNSFMPLPLALSNHDRSSRFIQPLGAERPAFSSDVFPCNIDNTGYSNGGFRTFERLVPRGQGRSSSIERHVVPCEHIRNITDPERVFPCVPSVFSRAEGFPAPIDGYPGVEDNLPWRHYFPSAERKPNSPDHSTPTDPTTLTSPSQNNIATLTGQLSTLSTSNATSPTANLDTWDPVPFSESHTRPPTMHLCDSHVHHDGPEWRRKHPNRPCTYEPGRSKLIRRAYTERNAALKEIRGNRVRKRARLFRRRYDPYSSTASSHRSRNYSPPLNEEAMALVVGRPLHERAVQQFGEEDVKKWGERRLLNEGLEVCEREGRKMEEKNLIDRLEYWQSEGRERKEGSTVEAPAKKKFARELREMNSKKATIL